VWGALVIIYRHPYWDAIMWWRWQPPQHPR
jgi:hypothetical protein